MKSVGQKNEVARFLDAWFTVRQYIQAANFNRFQGAGLSATQFMTLNLLPSDGEGVSIGDLARRMNLKPATVAKTVDSLETRKMIARIRNVSDKRLVFVKITKTGLVLQNSANGQFKKQIGKLFKAMLPEEGEGLVLGLESLVRAATSGKAATRSRARRVPDVAAPAKRSLKRSRRL